MSFQQTPFTLPLLFSGGISSALAAYVLLRVQRARNEDVPGAVPFACVAIAGAVWAIAYGFQLASPGLEGKVFWSRILWFGAAPATTIWLVFVLAYTDNRWFTRRTVAMLAVEPLGVIGLVWTNHVHRLFILDVELASAGSFTVLEPTFGPLFAVHLAYSYVLNLVGIVLLVRLAVSAHRPHRNQAMILLASVGVILVANVATIIGAASTPNIDLTPLSFPIATALMAWALVRYDLFDIVPLALGAVMDTVPDAMVVVDRRGRIAYLNDVAKDLLGDHGTVGTPATRALASFPDVLELMTTAGGGKILVATENGDGRRFFEASVTRIDQHTDGDVIVLRDVTESQNAEIRFRTLVERSSDVIWIVNEEGRCSYVSPSIERVLGYDPETLIGEVAFDLIHPEDYPDVIATFAEVLSGSNSRVEFRAQHKDGTLRVFEALGSNMFDEPAIEGVVVNSRDITDRQRYEQRLRVLNRVLRHDLRNDVSVIQGYVDLIADSVGDPKMGSWANVVDEKCTELITLSEKAQMIDYTIHREEHALKRFEIASHLHKMLESARRDYPHAQIEIDVEKQIWVYADPLIDSAIDNLVENAVKHNDRSNPHVTVSVSSVGVDGVEYVDLVFTDNGPGIGKAEQRVLKQGIETPLEHASGLGLWLVNWIVENSDGTLLLDANEPRGSEITIRLLRAPPNPRSSERMHGPER